VTAPKNLGVADTGDTQGDPQASPYILVRATVHLAGGPDEPALRPGDVALVDARAPGIRPLLGIYLIPLPANMQPPQRDVT
jgi:hypothetical protein